MQNRVCLDYIDKTESLEEGIRRFPSIYIEGNAAVGKTTAVNMLRKKHPEAECCVLELDTELGEPQRLLKRLNTLQERLNNAQIWVILGNIPEYVDHDIADALVKLVQGITNESRVIFVSREKPQTEFLDLLWKRKMKLIPMESLLLSPEEVRSLGEYYKSALRAEAVHQMTGGWAGCVDLLFRLSDGEKSVEELLESYEVKNYIRQTMLAVLHEEEKDLLEHGAGCPWIDPKLCAQVWGITDAEEKLKDLQRKGMLLFEAEKQRWKIAPLFAHYVAEKSSAEGKESQWYEANGHIAEALCCLRKNGSGDDYRECMIRYYDRVYALGMLSEEVLQWNQTRPEVCYLRGAYAYSIADFEGLKKEVSHLSQMKEKDQRTKEILLNLQYMNVEISLTEWLELVADYTQTGEKFRLYQILGNSVTYLCGIRDLSAMFSCTKKEERYREHLWREAFTETEWKCYQLARIDHRLETERKDHISAEDWELLRGKMHQNELWQLRMAKLYLLCKLQRIQPEEERTEDIHQLEASLSKENHPVCPVMAESVSSLYAPWYGARERMTKWLRYAVMDSTVTIGEDNWLMFYCYAKGYVLLNQYERAEKILKKLVPYLQSYQRNRFAAEVYFQYALVNMGKALKGQAVKNTIESFLISRGSRYVHFYTGYGQKGQQVLEAYMEWMHSNMPEGWSYKKKYQYGNVLRMPVEDYVQMILRCAKKALKSEGNLEREHVQERLTMMETIVLQDIGMGKSNAQICEELGLKLPTVKGHVCSLFKKLEVNSRVQAVIKGKELGILE